MSQRPSIYVSRKLAAPRSTPPSSYYPQITTELRSIAPAETPSTVLVYELSMAVREFARKMHTWPGPDAKTIEQVESELSVYGITVPDAWRAGGPLFPGSGGSS